MEINIPEDHRKAFARLSGVDDRLFESILGALKATKPCLRLAELRQRVHAAVKSVLPDEERLTEAIVILANTASRLEFSSDISEKDVLQSVATTVAMREGLDQEHERCLLVRLGELSSLPLIHVSAKSSTLQVAHDRIYNSSKIITDLRPVFGEPIDSSDLLFMVIHHLHIIAMRNGKPEELYLSMDDKDLDMLRDAVDRARAKASLLRSTLQEHQLNEIDGGAQ